MIFPFYTHPKKDGLDTHKKLEMLEKKMSYLSMGTCHDVIPSSTLYKKKRDPFRQKTWNFGRLLNWTMTVVCLCWKYNVWDEVIKKNCRVFWRSIWRRDTYRVHTTARCVRIIAHQTRERVLECGLVKFKYMIGKYRNVSKSKRIHILSWSWRT